jgi:hypothetical protein
MFEVLRTLHPCGIRTHDLLSVEADDDDHYITPPRAVPKFYFLSTFVFISKHNELF